MLNNYKLHAFSFLKGGILVLGLWLIRFSFTGSSYYLFLLWNLFLAFVPFVFSTALLQISSPKKIIFWVYFFAWLFFFPNAPYIITDLVHLSENKIMPVWYDAVLLFISALNGLWIGGISLMQMELVWRKNFPKIKARYFLAIVMILSGFGIYLGRVLRFNSWDIITEPKTLIRITALRIFFPFHYIHTWAVTGIFALVFWVMYAQVKKVSLK